MQPYAVILKNVGETPLEAVEAYRKKERIPLEVPLAYAGRLDPMASGKLLVLIGDECKKQSAYHTLDKEYVFEILFGFLSDTGDVLGIVERKGVPRVDVDDLRNTLKTLVGTVTLPYPVFSSKTVHGKPLFLWQLEGRINEIDIPSKESTVYTLSCIGSRSISKESLCTEVIQKINSIPKVTEESKALGADFRRANIRQRWSEIFNTVSETEFQIASFRCVCSSGTYMRTLAAHIAQNLGTTGLAYSIERMQIGRYTHILPGIRFWTKRY